MSDADLSIVIPLYNRAHTIERTLRSLFLSGQTGLDVVVVDDGSSDNGCAMVEKLAAEEPTGIALRLIRQANAGPGAARNTGARAAYADWVAFLDSDDFWMPWTPQIVLQTLRDRPDCRALLLRTAMFEREDALDAVERSDAKVRWHDTILDMRVAADRLKQYGSCNLAMHRQTFLELDGFTDLTRCGEDIDFLCRAGDVGPVASIAEPVLVAFRNGGADSLGRDMEGVCRGALFLLSRETGGAYDGCGQDALRRTALCYSLVFTINRFFRAGHPRLAYRLWARAARFLAANGRFGLVVKLGLTPILSVVRPRHYRFRLRPLGADGREPGFDAVNNG